MSNTISSSVPKVLKVPFVPKSFIFLFLCLAPACTDYLDVRPENQLLPEDFRQKESDVEAALMACYRAMQEDEFMWRVIVWGELRSDNVMTSESAVNWRWRKEGDLSDIPGAWNEKAIGNASVTVARNFLGSDRYVEDGSYRRINQLTFNYAIPDKWLSKMSVASASAFLTVYNLYCFTSYSGVDPEVGYGSWGVSTDSNQTPRAKSFTAGISVRF